MKLPRTEFKIAAVSLPCAALVRITALETGGGIQATVIRLQNEKVYMNQLMTYDFQSYPFNTHIFTPKTCRIFTNNCVNIGINMKV